MSSEPEAEPAPLNRRRLLPIGVAVYLAVIFAVMLWRGVSIEPQWVALALLLVAVALGRGKVFIFDWLPFLVLFFAYEVMRGFAAKTGFAAHDITGLERFVFLGSLPTLTLQHWFYNPNLIGVQDWAAMVLYFLHFPVPLLVGFVFWWNRREHYWRFVAALLLMCFLAFITYLFWPSDPPWYINKQDGVVKVIDETIRKWGVQYFVSPVYTNLNPNKFAAFPSLHAAFPALGAMYAWSRYRWLALILIPYTVCVWIAIVYLGEHYFVDALAGLVYAVLATLLVEAFVRRARPSS